MRIVVNYDLCESNAICMELAPDLFEVRDDDLVYVLNTEPGAELSRHSILAPVRITADSPR